jgi:hypothetical protein
VHEGGWRVTAEADGEFCFHSPAGAPLASVPPQERVSDGLGWLHEWAEENSLDIGPETNYPQWQGEKPDYDLAVSGLLAAS